MRIPVPQNDLPPIEQTCAVIVPAFNSAQHIVRCLDAVTDPVVAEILVVDNNSHDATVALVRRHHPAVRLVPLPKNVGFAGACNMGIALSKAPFVLLLNDDATLTHGYVQSLLQTLQANVKAASATGKLLRDCGRIIDSTGILLGKHTLRPRDRGENQMDVGQYETPGHVFGPSGAAAMYRRAALQSLHEAHFDETFFAYYEDVDLAWRLSNAGWHHLYVPHARARHSRRGPGAKPVHIAARAFLNRYKVWRKNETLAAFCRYAPWSLTWEGARLARLAWTRPKLARAVLRLAVRDVLH